MKFNVCLVSWYHWYSDIKEMYQEFQHVATVDLEKIVQELKNHPKYKNRQQGQYVTILIEPEEKDDCLDKPQTTCTTQSHNS